MNREGPALETLLRRLSETPAPFLAEPLVGKTGTVHVAAVVADLCRLFDGVAVSQELARFTSDDGSKEARNLHATALLLCWMLHDPWFRQSGFTAVDISTLI